MKKPARQVGGKPAAAKPRAEPTKPRSAGGSRASRPGGGPGDLLWALLLVLLAWLHRIFFILSNNDRGLPFSGFYHGDAETFFRHARAILAGQEYDAGLPFHPPGFPYLLAGVHSLLGAGAEGAKVPHLGVKIVLAGIASLAIGGLYLLVRPYLGRTVALLTAGLAAWHFGLSVLAAAPVGEGVYLTLLIAALLIFCRKLDHPLAAPDAGSRFPPLWGLALGALLGLAALTRAETPLLAVLLVGVGLVGWLLRRAAGRATGADLAPWLLAALAFALTLLPWTLRNHRTLSAVNTRLGSQLAEPLPTFVPLTLYGPINLALANHEGADGTFSRDLMASQRQTGRLELTDREHLRYLLHGDEIAWAFIAGQPRQWLDLVRRKWLLAADAGKLGWTQWNLPGGLSGVRRPVDVFVPYSNAGWYWLLPGVVAGVVLCLVRPGPSRRWLLVVALLAFAFATVVALFFGYARQGLLFLPFCLSFVAVALETLVSLVGRVRGETLKTGGEPSRGFLRFAAGFAVALLLVEAWGATRDRRYQATGTTIAGQRTLNPDLTVYLRPLPARAPQ